MSPFYVKVRGKEGDSWVRWDGEPRDIRTPDNQRDTGVSIYSVPGDPEQVQVGVLKGKTVHVRGERGAVIFPGENQVLNRDDFDVVEASGEIVARVIHSGKPIK